MAQKKITDLQLRSSVDDTVNFPSDDTIQSYRVTAAQIRSYLKDHWEKSQGYIKNLGLSVTAGSSAMTVALKQSNGSSDPASTNSTTLVQVLFRSPTLTSGANVLVEFNAALSIVIPSTATMGYENGDAVRVFIYAYYDGTNKGLMVTTRLLDEAQLYSLTQIGTGSDSFGLYADAARSGAAVRLLGEFGLTAITTAGTWTSPTWVATMASCYRGKGLLRTIVYTAGTSTYHPNPYSDFVVVRGTAGGGGGGGAPTTTSNQAACCAGGGAGATFIKKIATSAITAAGETVTVGAGGTAGSAGGNTGGTGGTTSFGSHASATGGTGGSASSASTGFRTVLGPSAASATGGDMNIYGGTGGSGISGGNVYPQLSGHGGASFYGGGGYGAAGTTGAVSGGDGNPYGAGGGGSCNGTGAQAGSAGGAGAAGVLYLEEHKN